MFISNVLEKGPLYLFKIIQRTDSVIHFSYQGCTLLKRESTLLFRAFVHTEYD